MKTAEKFAAGWLLTLGFMFLTTSGSAVITKHTTLKPTLLSIESQDVGKDFINTEALYQLDHTATQGLMFGIPTALLGGWLVLGMCKQKRQSAKALMQEEQRNLHLQEQERLSQFYQLLQANDGKITLLGFAMQSQLPAAEAKQFLDQKAKEFNANFQVNEEGSISYHFDV
ncbi:MAG: hypothetical protein F6K61_14665 [Sphaerospermopsis sp. SIO1G1]|nr:hypothetical protein [Sphaerospermopsis sp. SIO1G1]